MSKHGFKVQKHFILPTAWQATYTQGNGGRTIGINSEMDALPGIGHACGHNLIAISGVGVACAIKAAMERFEISGTILVLGTPGMCPFNTCLLPCFIYTARWSQLKKEGTEK
jgi:metal-dependent amidase/aminoacylase/carboxypeptidase family protein